MRSRTCAAACAARICVDGVIEPDVQTVHADMAARAPCARQKCIALWLVLVLGFALAAGHDAESGTSAAPPVASRQPQDQTTLAAGSVSSFLSSLPPVSHRTAALPALVHPHARLRAPAVHAAPAMAPMRCLVAGQIHGGRGQGLGSDGGTRHRSSGRASSLVEEVRRSGSCILGFGANDAGQLVLGHDKSTRVPQLAEGLPSYVATAGANTSVRVGPPVAAISAGGYHTLLLDLDGSAYAVGENFRGQLGNGCKGLASLNPVLIRIDATGAELPPVRGIAAGSSHSVLVTTDGYVYTCGEGAGGRLGIGKVEALSGCQGLPKQGGAALQRADSCRCAAPMLAPSARAGARADFECVCWRRYVCLVRVLAWL